MEELASAVSLLEYLLPGFIVAWVFFGLTGHYRPDKFERTIQALIFSVFVRSLVSMLGYAFLQVGQHGSFGSWDQEAQLIWSVILALSLGLLFAWFGNTDALHKALRRWGITKQTVHPTEWYGIFNDSKLYVVLHLVGERRLMGWPREWPNKATDGHFVMADACWISEDGDYITLGCVDAIVVRATDVEMVEFIKPSELESQDRDSQISASSTAAANQAA